MSDQKSGQQQNIPPQMLAQGLDPNIMQLMQMLMAIKQGRQPEQPAVQPVEQPIEQPALQQGGQTIGGLDPQTWLRMYQYGR